MFKINVKNMYKLTRTAKAIKDREFLSATGQTEIRRLAKIHRYGFDPDTTGLNLAQQKSVRMIDDAITIINERYGTDHIQNKTVYSDDLFYAIPHIVDGSSIHIIHIPYTFITHASNDAEIVDIGSWDEVEYYIKATVFIMNKYGVEIDKVYYHDVLLDTPDDLIGESYETNIHKLGDIDIDKRITTKVIDISYDQNIKNGVEIIDAKDKILKFFDYLKVGG